MTDEFKDLAARLVVGHKRDGRSVYDEQAKLELVMACRRPGVSVARVARECGVNANQVSRWLREHEQRSVPVVTSAAADPASAFVAARVEVPSTTCADGGGGVRLQARLPNGVVVDLREVDAASIVAAIDALGRLRCSASTSA